MFKAATSAGLHCFPDEIEATQRATAMALGVSQVTVQRDLSPDTNESKHSNNQAQNKVDSDTNESTPIDTRSKMHEQLRTLEAASNHR